MFILHSFSKNNLFYLIFISTFILFIFYSFFDNSLSIVKYEFYIFFIILNFNFFFYLFLNLTIVV